MTRNKILVGVLEYWRSKLARRALPSRSDIVPGELREYLPFLFIADVQRGSPVGTEIILRLVGTHIERSFGCDLTGLPVGGLNKHWPDFVVGRDLFDAVNHRSVIITTHKLRGGEAKKKPTLFDSGEAVLSYHRLVLPLASDGKNVDRLLGVLVCETTENMWSLWQAPFVFEEQNKKTLSYPYDWPERPLTSRAQPERQLLV